MSHVDSKETLELALEATFGRAVFEICERYREPLYKAATAGFKDVGAGLACKMTAEIFAALLSLKKRLEPEAPVQ